MSVPARIDVTADPAILADVNTCNPLVVNDPPTFKFPPTPIPPDTINAPEVVLTDEAVLDIVIICVEVAPLLVTDCRVLVFQTVTYPVLVLTAVSVPANN